MHPVYTAAVVVFGALFFGVMYYVSSRESPRLHSYSNDVPRHGPDTREPWNRRGSGNSGVRCGICLDTEDGPTKVLQCFHEFHSNCISRWYRSNSNGARSCPLCRHS